LHGVTMSPVSREYKHAAPVDNQSSFGSRPNQWREAYIELD
jgi:hypothetical protein